MLFVKATYIMSTYYIHLTIRRNPFTSPFTSPFYYTQPINPQPQPPASQTIQDVPATTSSKQRKPTTSLPPATHAADVVATNSQTLDSILDGVALAESASPFRPTQPHLIPTWEEYCGRREGAAVPAWYLPFAMYREL